jgi:hypothetical protein
MLFSTYSLFSFILILLQIILKNIMAIPAVPQLSKLQLDCHRIPSTFCCSSRIRNNCAQLCASSPSINSCLGGGFPSPSFPHIPLAPTSFGGSFDQNFNQPNQEETFFNNAGDNNKRPTTEGGGGFRNNFGKIGKNFAGNEQGQRCGCSRLVVELIVKHIPENFLCFNSFRKVQFRVGPQLRTI